MPSQLPLGRRSPHSWPGRRGDASLINDLIIMLILKHDVWRGVDFVQLVSDSIITLISKLVDISVMLKSKLGVVLLFGNLLLLGRSASLSLFVVYYLR